MSPLRILILEAQVPFVHGGAEILVRQLHKAIAARGHLVEVVSVPFQHTPKGELWAGSEPCDARSMKDRGEQATFLAWLQKNADAAWRARRTPDNLSWCKWPQPTPDGRRYSWGCSSAVVTLQVVPPTEVFPPPAP